MPVNDGALGGDAWTTRSLCLHRMRRFRHASHATRLGPSTLVLGVLMCWPGMEFMMNAAEGTMAGAG